MDVMDLARLPAVVGRDKPPRLCKNLQISVHAIADGSEPREDRVSSSWACSRFYVDGPAW